MKHWHTNNCDVLKISLYLMRLSSQSALTHKYAALYTQKGTNIT